MLSKAGHGRLELPDLLRPIRFPSGDGHPDRIYPKNQEEWGRLELPNLLRLIGFRNRASPRTGSTPSRNTGTEGIEPSRSGFGGHSAQPTLAPSFFSIRIDVQFVFYGSWSI